MTTNPNALRETLLCYDISLQVVGMAYIGPCPFCEVEVRLVKDLSPSLVVISDYDLFICRRCKASGGVIDFLRQMEDISTSEARKLV